MHASQPFTFGIPVMPRVCARNWARVERLLDLTLASVLAQTDADFEVLVIGHDRPRLPDDPRISFLPASWPAEAIDSRNSDRGRKTHAINARVLERGGGLLMFLDADDWVDVHLVEAARCALGPGQVGAVIDCGFAVDFQTLKTLRLPDTAAFPGEFHRVCGSSLIVQLRPGDPSPLHADPYRLLHDHHRVTEDAAAHGAELVHLPTSAAYIVNTEDNHSEVHGPYTEWRRTFVAQVNRGGVPLDASLAARFGLDLTRLRGGRRASRRAS